MNLQSNRFDIEAEISAKMLKRGDPDLRGADLVLRAASSTKARRSRGATVSPRCTRSSSTASGTDGRVTRAWAAVVVNYRVGLAAHRVRAIGARRLERRRRRARRRRQRLATTARSTLLRSAVPDVHVITSPGNVGYARAANLGIAATRRADRRGAESRPHDGRGDGEGDAGALRRGAGARRVRTRASATSTAPTTRRPGVRRRSRSRSRTACSGCGGRRTRSRPGTASSTPTPTRPRSVDWVSGAAVWLRRSALDVVGGWDERYFMYMEDLDLCWRLRRAGFDVAYEPAGAVTPRAGREHFAHSVPNARPAPPLRPGGSPGADSTGASAVLLPFAAVYLAGRCALAMAEHAWHASRPGSAPRLACPS